MDVSELCRSRRNPSRPYLPSPASEPRILPPPPHALARVRHLPRSALLRGRGKQKRLRSAPLRLPRTFLFPLPRAGEVSSRALAEARRRGYLPSGGENEKLPPNDAALASPFRRVRLCAGRARRTDAQGHGNSVHLASDVPAFAGMTTVFIFGASQRCQRPSVAE